MEWLFNAEQWLMAPAIPLWLVIFIVIFWPEIPRRLRLVRQAKPEEKRKEYVFLVAALVVSGLLAWSVITYLMIALRSGVN
ncbi:hypothetical protein [Wenzhouxiangella sp. XN24]|uniref:hypothetical protein n=1 Tax=Wenzhouxiangella sp. XN24 TaxID=2713569 RepID=UPI0013EB2498|nr:hypothetical protein [Wenzhouxiangella sp. XN24]NGX17325.1 hypothetical protein [Wenzhouxiangella sp. XN24]